CARNHYGNWYFDVW
nr:immunoglobulin heavy chain junction region [Mus musculus]NSM04225.1 immunoglobulin heavy chain junction region [Mus musculus]NSM08024.1 immunoglobulin heavy chain junction region [Mus musculus]NSM08199.1 immunoglobulin heavy chain junction region [Mus musculus]NSM08297.1 immunoglobulin heavy chain junction region [Mus musculus]